MRLLHASLLVLLAGTVHAQKPFDLLLKGGHLIDPRNEINSVRDLAIRNGRIAAVAEDIDSASAIKTVFVHGLYVVPGLIDLHVHVYAGTGERNSYAGDRSVHPDGFTFRSGVTTVVDAGSAGWRNFEDFKQRIIDRSRTRVLAFLNIVGHGMRMNDIEQNLDDMRVEPTVTMARRHKDVIVGIKTAHYRGRDFTPVERATEAGNLVGVPVMVDFGTAYHEKSLGDLLARKLRPGDIYTHVYSGRRGELNPSGHANLALFVGRRRGVLYDVGHGAGSFAWRVAIPIIGEGVLPDTISTDLHTGSMNAGMKDMLNVMSKFLALGLSLGEVIERSTWKPAQAVRQPRLGHLSVQAPADVAVLRLESGEFGFVDMSGLRFNGTHKLTCEMTLRDGKIVYELNGLSRPLWNTLHPNYEDAGDPRWDATIDFRKPTARRRPMAEKWRSKRRHVTRTEMGE